MYLHYLLAYLFPGLDVSSPKKSHQQLAKEWGYTHFGFPNVMPCVSRNRNPCPFGRRLEVHDTLEYKKEFNKMKARNEEMEVHATEAAPDLGPYWDAIASAYKEVA